MNTMNLFKIQYSWYDGDEDEILLAKDATQEQFDKDIMEARDIAQSLIKTSNSMTNIEHYNVECLPSFYQEVIKYLQKQKGYIEISPNDDFHYEVHDKGSENKEIEIIKVEIHTLRKDGKPGGKFVEVDLNEQCV